MMVQSTEGGKANIHQSLPCLFRDSQSTPQMPPLFSKLRFASAGWMFSERIPLPKLIVNGETWKILLLQTLQRKGHKHHLVHIPSSPLRGGGGGGGKTRKGDLPKVTQSMDGRGVTRSQGPDS